MGFANTRAASDSAATSEEKKMSSSSSSGGGDEWLRESIKLRDLNQMRIIMKTSTGEKLEYSAYIDGGFSTDVSVPMNDFALNPGEALTAGANLFGFAPAFDMPRYFMFKGSQPLKFTINTYLKADYSKFSDQDVKDKKTVLEKFYQEPLKNLFKMCLPITSAKSLPELAENTVISDWLSGISLFGLEKTITARLKEVKLMTVPESINPTLDGKGERMKLQMGLTPDGWAIEFKDIIVTNVRLGWGKLILDRGYPDRIEVGLSIETLRPATTDLIENFLTIPK